MSREPVRLTATPSQTVGPFFHFGLADDDTLGCLAGAGTKATRVRLRVRVTDGDGRPVPDALVDLWQADADGAYARAPGVGEPPAFSGFGRLPTSEDGDCVFETIHPGGVSDVLGRIHAPHVDVCLFARGLLRHVYTRIYFEGDAALAEDPILVLVPDDRRSTLVARRTGDEWVFHVRLQGQDETVFFDL
jgi:protocatechuate 3,4-dioxygenase alpha subunit